MPYQLIRVKENAVQKTDGPISQKAAPTVKGVEWIVFIMF